MRAEKQSASQQIEQIWEEADREEQRFLANSPLEGDPPKFNIGYSGSSSWSGRRYGFNMTKVDADSEPSVPHFQNYQSFIGGTHIRLAEKAGLIREQHLARTDIRQATWDKRLMKFSPASLYAFSTSAWAGTDLNGMLDFVHATQGYRQTLINYFRDKDAFVSRQWFASDQGAVDWWDLPRFRFVRADVWENTQRALADVSLLFLMNLILFIATFLIFIRVEV